MIKAKRLILSLAMLSGLLLASAAAPVTSAFAAEGPVVVLLQAEPVSLDPMFTQSDAHTILSIHEGLFRLDNDGKIVPAVAESITNVDPLTWDVKIRQGSGVSQRRADQRRRGRFHVRPRAETFRRQPGRPDLRDGRAALRQGREDRRLHRAHQDEGAGSRSSRRTSSIRNFPSCRRSTIPSIRREEVTFAPVGAGGYKFVSYKAGEGMVLKAFDKYRLGKPPVDDVIVKAVPDVATRIAEMQAGSADLMMGVPADLKASLESSGVKVVVAPSYRRIFIAIKQGRHPALADVRVRQAMNYAFNCEEIAQTLLGGMAKCNIDLVNSPYNNPDLKPFGYDPEKAKKLLDEAGWVAGADGIRAKDGVRLSLADGYDRRLVSDGQGDRSGRRRLLEGGRHRDQGSGCHRIRRRTRRCAQIRAPATAT